MRLKSLEIKGFKSFGNATTLYFDENVTGIVGPNGSGKSNVVDAFRWVLGEQKSRELRLEQMGDVLFNGAAKKQQANHAEVSITFDNTKNILPTEYNTVKITRALYRSGESEYRINDVNCRLKDIHILLMDTGIGSNSYSIIELGMVDDILSDKENARRRMFEQAAGISKFKKRKKETLQKLKLTNADLERVADLLFEIEKNLKDLEKQAKRTKKYFEIKAKYRSQSILLYKLKWEDLENGVHSLRQKIQEHSDAYNLLSTNLSRKEAILEEEKRKNLEGEKDLSSYQKKLNDLLDDIRRSENEKNLLAQKIVFSEKNISKAKNEILQAEPQLEQVQITKTELGNEYKKNEGLYLENKRELDRIQDLLDSINSKFKSNKEFQEEKAAKLQLLQNSIFNTDKELAVLQNKEETYIRTGKENKALIDEILKGSVVQEEKLKELQGRLLLLGEELLQVKEKEEHRKESISSIEGEISKAKDELAKFNRSSDALINERDLLKSMIENLEGFSESVKFLHQKWQGKKTLLSDVINTSEEYRAAVEQVLRPYLDHFIVENAEEARTAIGLLQRSQKGKAQFFLLDAVTKTQPEALKDSISTVIECDEKYRPLINLICGHVVIKSEDEIFKIAEDSVSATGSILRTPNQINGGSVGLFEGKKIGRKKRIEELEKQLRHQTVKIEGRRKILGELEAQVKDFKTKDYEREIKVKEHNRAGIEKEVILLKAKIESAEGRITTIRSNNLELQTKQEEITQKLGELNLTKTNTEIQIQQLRVELSEQNSEIEVLSNELSTSRQNYNAQNIKLIQNENLLLGIKKDLNFQDRRSEELRRSLFEAKKTLDRQEIELKISSSDLAGLKILLEKKYEQKDKDQDQLSSAEQNYFKARALANQVEDEIRALSKKIKETQYLVNELKDKLNDYKFKKNSIKERLNIEFDCKISDLLEVDIEDQVQADDLALGVEKFKKRLENYGEINPMALEAYDEMEQRFIHITAQRDDITAAKESLISTISEIEDTATQLFLESFNEVRKHFMVVFRSLFTQDDDCDLILLDQDDPLNSKIEIIAKPKGKRPKSLSQLSGGEKTLTATALLFALYLLKPAPFCIFDEVDAPLDDTNIQKFANIIRAFSDKSQFLVVTHNKATMAEVDVLYGVFMQKKGISSVSAVDFRTYQEKGTTANVAINTY